MVASSLDQFHAPKQALLNRQAEAHKAFIVAEERFRRAEADLNSGTQQKLLLAAEAEKLKLAAVFLQGMVDAIAARNIGRTEELVNSALKTVFPDMNLDFRIVSEIKRNTVNYRIALYQDGIEGNLNSYGGGVSAFIAVVLKILFNILAKRYPLLAFDESLSFLSEKYIAPASDFLKQMTKPAPEGFGLPILLVTHQPLFAKAADSVYQASRAGNRTVSFKKITQTPQG